MKDFRKKLVFVSDLRASNDVVSVNPNAESKVTEKRSQEEVEVQQVLSGEHREPNLPFLFENFPFSWFHHLLFIFFDQKNTS